MGNGALGGMEIGTAIMPGPGTVVGTVIGGLTDMFSGPEAQQHASNIGGRSIDARQIWEQINPGNSGSVQGGAQAAGQLQSVHDQRASQIDAINQMMDQAWQGDASQAAQGGAHPLGIWLRDSASNLGKSQTYLNNQGEAFDTTHSKVQEIASTPPSSSMLDDINPFSDKDDEINKYNQQGQANVDAFNAYYTTSAQNAAAMPQYGAFGGDPTSNPPAPNPPPPGPGPGPGPGPTPGPGPGGPVGPIGRSPKPPTPPTPPPLNRYTPHPITGPTPTPPPPITNPIKPTPPTYPPPGGWNSGTTAASYDPNNSSTTGFGPTGFGPMGSGGGSYGDSGSGSGSGGGGVGGVGGFGPTGSGGALAAGASTGAGAGGESGVARGGVAAGGAAGAAGRAGSSGMGGMGAGRGGGGKGAEDEEHQSKYLIGDDPNELFGTDELTAPPVIGE